jgi:hypothetical protein
MDQANKNDINDAKMCEINLNSKNELSSPYHFHNPVIIEKILDMIETYNNIIETAIDEQCCICLDSKKFYEKTYFKCKHFVCIDCFVHADMKISHTPCPLCRCPIEKYII